VVVTAAVSVVDAVVVVTATVSVAVAVSVVEAVVVTGFLHVSVQKSKVTTSGSWSEDASTSGNQVLMWIGYINKTRLTT
jgi:hypothetical protein